MSTHETEKLGPFITNRFGDRYLYEVNRSAFDQVGSEAVYQKYFGEEFSRPNRLYIIVGTDSGVLLSYLKKRTLPEGSRYLLVELPGVVEALRDVGGLEDLPERICVVTLEELWSQAEAFQLQNYLFLGAVELHDSLAAMDANLLEYRDISDHLREKLQAIDWATRGSLGCRDFIVRQLENLGENRIPAICLKGKFAGKTAVILGGGPSLDEILPWIKENQDKIAIFAVSRVSKRLLEYGLTPHLIFSVDPHDVSFEVSREMLHFWNKSLFVHSYHVSPKLLGQWRGRSVFVGDRFPWPSETNPKNLGGAGPTVTNTALTAAIEMGFAQVVLAGVDLCFSQSGMTHAGGSIENSIGPKLDNVLTVETNGGWRAETGPDYFKAMEVLGQQADIAQKLGCKVVNPAAGAAKIPNISHVLLQEIDFAPLESPIDGYIASLLPEDASLQRLEYYEKVRKELEDAKTQFIEIKKLAGEALYCNKGLFGKIGKKADFKYKIRMDKIERRLNEDFADLVPLVKKFGIENFLKITRLDNDSEWSDKEIEEKAEVYYQAYSDSASRILEILKQAIDRIDARMLEESSKPSLEKLIEAWRRDGQPGRLYVWLDRLEKNGVDPPQHELLEVLGNDFETLLTNSDTVQAKRLAHMRDLGPVRGKAQRLFGSKDRNALERLGKALEGHANQEQAMRLNGLVQGYLAELDQDYGASLESYQVLIGEEFDPLTEDALRRIASVGLKSGQIDFAKLALECLTSASFFYTPQYADLLRLLGQHQQAADLYVDYLENVPSDLGVLLKLGQLYQGMGAHDAARQVFQMVLEQDPDNGAARGLLSGVA